MKYYNVKNMKINYILVTNKTKNAPKQGVGKVQSIEVQNFFIQSVWTCVMTGYA